MMTDYFETEKPDVAVLYVRLPFDLKKDFQHLVLTLDRRGPDCVEEALEDWIRKYTRMPSRARTHRY